MNLLKLFKFLKIIGNMRLPNDKTYLIFIELVLIFKPNRTLKNR